MGDEREAATTFAVVLVIVVSASLVPAPAAPDGESGTVAPPGTDALLHLVGYAAVAYTLAGTVAGRRGGDADRTGLPAVALVGVVVVAAAVGGGVEVAQGAVPGRTPSTLDAVANAVGAVAGAALWRRRAGRP